MSDSGDSMFECPSCSTSSPLLDEKAQELPSRHKRSLSFLQAFIFGLVAFLFLLIGFGFGILTVKNSPELSAQEFPGVPNRVSAISTPTRWFPNEEFGIERQDAEAEAIWESYASRFIWVDDAPEKGTPPSWPVGDTRQAYSLAAFHQLHCITVIRYGWNRVIKDGTSVLSEEFPGSRGEYTIGNHFVHCVELVRQALECHADPTLEPMLERDGVTVSDIGLASGWGVVHMCRNFTRLVQWADEQEPAYFDV